LTSSDCDRPEKKPGGWPGIIPSFLDIFSLPSFPHSTFFVLLIYPEKISPSFPPSRFPLFFRCYFQSPISSPSGVFQLQFVVFNIPVPLFPPVMSFPELMSFNLPVPTKEFRLISPLETRPGVYPPPSGIWFDSCGGLPLTEKTCPLHCRFCWSPASDEPPISSFWSLRFFPKE